MRFPSKETVERIRREYPVGCRVELVSMDDPYNTSLRPGALGTVKAVDDCATIHVSWDCGSSLGVVYGEDFCRRVREETKSVKIDPALIPDEAIERACRVLDSSIRLAMADPEKRAEYEAWKQSKEERKA